MNKLYFIFSCLGLAGGLLCCTGDISLLAPTVTVIIAICNGALDVPKVCVLLNPLVFLIFGLTCRKINAVKFQDLPGIIMPSLGLGMFGLIGMLNLL